MWLTRTGTGVTLDPAAMNIFRPETVSMPNIGESHLSRRNGRMIQLRARFEGWASLFMDEKTRGRI